MLRNRADVISSWLAGRRTVGRARLYDEGHAILGDARHQETLTLARAGVLPFLAWLAIVVWAWARRLDPAPRR